MSPPNPKPADSYREPKPFRRHLRLILILLLLLAAILLPFAGPWLQRSDRLQKSDAIIMLMGSIGDRVLAVNEIYESKMAPEVILCTEANPGLELLRAKGVTIAGTTDQVVTSFLQLGLPDTSLTIIPGNATSTIMEAQLLAAHLQQHYRGRSAPFRLILVSSPSHTRRATMIFRRALRHLPFKVEVLAAPSPYGSALTHDWFLHREQIQDVLYEYIKLTAWLLIERWRL